MMQKAKWVSVVLLLSFIVAGCGRNDNSEANERISALEAEIAELREQQGGTSGSAALDALNEALEVAVDEIRTRADDARLRVAVSEIQRLSMAVDEFYLDNGRAPGELRHLLERPPNFRHWRGPYIDASNLSDPWGNPYQYRYPGQHKSFDLYSFGPRGRNAPQSEHIGNWQ